MKPPRILAHVTLQRHSDDRYKLELRKPEPDGGANGPLFDVMAVRFQRGAVDDVGVNGWPEQALLAVVRERQLRLALENPDNAAVYQEAVKFIDAAITVLNTQKV